MKSIVLLLICCGFTLSAWSQSSIVDYLEGRKFKNSNTGLVIQYGYISPLNTYGITITNKLGTKFYFMNCSKDVNEDETIVLFTQCFNPDNGNGIGKVYATRTKIIVLADDGRMEYTLVKDYSSFHFISSQQNRLA